jgi:hypothetical protein
MKAWALVGLLAPVASSLVAASASVFLSASSIAAWTGANFFEEENVAGPNPNSADHALIRCDIDTGVLSTHLTQAKLRVFAGLPAGVFTANDIAADGSGIIYMVARDTSTGIEYLLRVSGEGVAAMLVQGTAADGTTAIALDPPRHRLLALTSTAAGAPQGGLEFIDLSASLPVASYTQIASESALESALTPSTPGQWLPSDLTVQSDGDAIIFNGGPNTGGGGVVACDGDCVRVTAAGAVSLFFDRGLLDGLFADPGTAGYGDAALAANGADEVLLLAFNIDTGGSSDVGEFFARVSADGSTATLVKTGADALAELGGGASLAVTRHGFALDSGGNAYWTNLGSGSPEGILMLTGPVPVELSAFGAD